MQAFTDLNDSLMIANKANYYTLAHEGWHILTNTVPHGKPANLSAGTTRVVRPSHTKETDTKRLTEKQGEVIRGSEYAKKPS